MRIKMPSSEAIDRFLLLMFFVIIVACALFIFTMVVFQ